MVIKSDGLVFCADSKAHCVHSHVLVPEVRMTQSSLEWPFLCLR
jgi:hypothetical protein